MTTTPPGRPSAVAEVLRRQAARHRAAALAAAPAPAAAPSARRSRRPLTPAQTLLLDGATASGAAAVVIGFALLVLGWRGVAATLDVQPQIAYLVSGGIGGLVLVGIGCGLLVVQADRYVDALENRAWADLARRWRDLGDAVAGLEARLETAAPAAAGAAPADPTVELAPIHPGHVAGHVTGHGPDDAPFRPPADHAQVPSPTPVQGVPA